MKEPYDVDMRNGVPVDKEEEKSVQPNDVPTYYRDPEESLIPDKYYKKFDFFYKRTCFRLMAEFYKLLFQPYQKQWVDQKKRGAMSNLVTSFAHKYFGQLLAQMNKRNQTEFLALLLVVVHSHRHNKQEEFLTDKMDFALVRDTMYKYSKKAQERFFSHPFLAFMLAWFALCKQGYEFVSAKYMNKGDDYIRKIKHEIDILKEDALVQISKASPDVRDVLIKALQI